MNFLINSSKVLDKIFINKISYNIIFRSSLNEEYKKKKFIENLKKLKNIEDIKNEVKEIDGYFSLILWSKDLLFCTVDQVCSYPLIYNIQNNSITIADHNNKTIKNDINHINLNAISLSGYGLSNYTNLNKFRSFKPCEYILVQRKKIIKSFWFSTEYKYKKNSKNISNKFENYIVKKFGDLKKSTQDQKIIVPLSAGIDSRFIVSALKYFGFNNFKTFTYGYTRLRDFEIAEKISKKINVENKKIFINPSLARKTYKSKKFLNYLNYKDLGIGANNPGDYLAINSLIEKKWIKPKNIIVNGQSGDFISGNHIPSFLIKNKTSHYNMLKTKVLDHIIEKHYNLWSEDLITDNQIQMRDVIDNLYFKNINNFTSLVEAYERFEYENRQIKWVVGQQKVYDFFNLQWTLPLWDRDLIKFFYREVSINDKKEQFFYKKFLMKKNYQKIWKSIKINPKENFNNKVKVLRFVLKSLFFFIGKKNWHKFEKRFVNYFIDSAQYPYITSYLDYILTAKVPRNAFAFISKYYLKKYKN